jgi:hypothetical protein
MKGHAGMLSIQFGNGSDSSYRSRSDRRAAWRRLQEAAGMPALIEGDGVSPPLARSSKNGSEREFGKLCILRDFLKNEEFGLGRG